MLKVDLQYDVVVGDSASRLINTAEDVMISSEAAVTSENVTFPALTARLAVLVPLLSGIYGGDPAITHQPASAITAINYPVYSGPAFSGEKFEVKRVGLWAEVLPYATTDNNSEKHYFSFSGVPANMGDDDLRTAITAYLTEALGKRDDQTANRFVRVTSKLVSKGITVK